MKILLASSDPSSIESVLRSAGHSCITSQTTTALKRLGQESVDCTIISCENAETLSIWIAGLREFTLGGPFVVVSHSESVLNMALDEGAEQICFATSLALLPSIARRASELGSIERNADDLRTRVKNLEEDTSALVDNLLDVVTILDIKGNITYESPSVKRALGYEQPDLIGKNAFTLIHPLDVPRVLPVFMLGVATPGSGLAAKFRFKHANGSWAFLESLGKAIRTPDGMRVMVTSRIVTEKAHLTTLGETETRFMNVVEALGEGLCIINRDAKITYANSRMTQLTGFNQEDLVGGIAKERLLGPDSWTSFDQCRALSLKGKSDEFEVQVKRKNGNSLWALMNVTPYVDHEGLIIGTLVAVTNVTERKIAEGKLDEARILLESRVEELAKSKHKAEEMSRLKSAFLANMSHEIRTPMNSILGFSSVLRDELKGTDAEEYAAMIESSGKRLLSTINGILDLSRIESNRMELTPAKVNLVEEIRDILHTLQPLANQKRIDLKFSPSQKINKAIAEIDPMGLAQIVTNLAGNAIKFTERGFVEVIADIEHSNVRDQKRSGITLLFIDSGIGISEEFIPHIFDEFKQESSGWARDYEGTGLGLTITKKLVDLLGGEISVKSSRGNGATFKVFLPCNLTTTSELITA